MPLIFFFFIALLQNVYGIGGVNCGTSHGSVHPPLKWLLFNGISLLETKFFKKVWSAIFLVILWFIWKERNERVFKNKASSSKEVLNLILLRLGWWIKGWKEPFPYTPEEVVRASYCLRWNEVTLKKKKHLLSLKIADSAK